MECTGKKQVCAECSFFKLKTMSRKVAGPERRLGISVIYKKFLGISVIDKYTGSHDPGMRKNKFTGLKSL